MRFDTAGAHAPDWSFDQALRPVSHILRHGIEPPWRAPTEEERGTLLRMITPVDTRFHASARTHVAFTMLPWYADGPLVRLVDPAWGDVSVHYLAINGDLFRLEGTSMPIHDANLRAPVQLTPANVLEYLKFFCYFVRGADGPFFLLERIDHPILTFEMDETTQLEFEAAARPARYEGLSESGNHLCSGVVFYGSGFFEARFEVQPTGMVEMLDDAPLAAALPVSIRHWLGGFR